MKIKTSYLFTALLLLLLGCSKEIKIDETPSDLKAIGLKGKVEYLVESIYTANNQYVIDTTQVFYEEKYKFNKNGNILKYSKNIGLPEYSIYEEDLLSLDMKIILTDVLIEKDYDEYGNCIRKIDKNRDHKINGKWSIITETKKFDSKNNIIELFKIEPGLNEYLIDSTHIKYDKYQNEIFKCKTLYYKYLGADQYLNKEIFNFKNTYNKTLLHKIDQSNEFYNSDKAIEYTINEISTYTYDNSNNLISNEVISTVKKGQKNKYRLDITPSDYHTKSEYVYDSSNNKLSEKRYYNGKLVTYNKLIISLQMCHLYHSQMCQVYHS